MNTDSRPPGDPNPPRRGRLWVFTAPSGAGKTTLVRELLARRPTLTFSISCTTRPARSGEVHGRDYFFVDPQQFQQKVAQDEMLEHADVFGHQYGTERAAVERQLDAGWDVLLEIDWQGARQVRGQMPDAIQVFIMPPSLAELSRRLRGRGTDDEQVIARRLASAREDISHWPEFDYVIVNDDLAAAVSQLMAVMDDRGEEASVRNPPLRARLQAIAAGD